MRCIASTLFNRASRSIGPIDYFLPSSDHILWSYPRKIDLITMVERTHNNQVTTSSHGMSGVGCRVSYN